MQPNEELLLSYGFVEANNQFDSVAIKVGVQPDVRDAYFRMRMQLLDWANLSTRLVVTFSSTGKGMIIIKTLWP